MSDQPRHPDAPYRDDQLGCYRVPLGHGRTALIDECDVAVIGQRRWTWRRYPDSKKRGYAVETPRRAKDLPTLMHHVILDVPAGTCINHRSDDTLDNRRANLRPADALRRSRRRRKLKPMSSVYKGVTRFTRDGRWVARITVDGVLQYLGSFDDERAAAAAYDAAAREHFKEFARPNLERKAG